MDGENVKKRYRLLSLQRRDYFVGNPLNKKRPGLCFSQRMRLNGTLAFLSDATHRDKAGTNLYWDLDRYMEHAEHFKIDNLLVLEAVRCKKLGIEPSPEFWNSIKELK